MVLEHIIPESWWGNHLLTSFLLAFMFSLLSIFIAGKVFGSSSGIVSVIFLTLFILPSMRRLFRHEERLEEDEKDFSWSHLWNDNKITVKAYTGVFLGVFLAFMMVTFLLPQLGFNAFDLLKQQLFLDPAVKGRAVSDLFSSGVLFSILENNWVVLLVTFIFAIIWGDGALFFVSWNASAWGAIFGFRAVASATVMGVSPWLNLGKILLFVSWHTMLEGLAYILAAIAGTIISYEMIKRSSELRRFVIYGLSSLLAGVFLSSIIRSSSLSLVAQMFIRIFMSLLLVYLMHVAITNNRHKRVFLYNFWLFVIAIGCFMLGVFVESLVLTYGDSLITIYRAAASI